MRTRRRLETLIFVLVLLMLAALFIAVQLPSDSRKSVPTSFEFNIPTSSPGVPDRTALPIIATEYAKYSQQRDAERAQERFNDWYNPSPSPSPILPLFDFIGEQVLTYVCGGLMFAVTAFYIVRMRRSVNPEWRTLAAKYNFYYSEQIINKSENGISFTYGIPLLQGLYRGYNFRLGGVHELLNTRNLILTFPSPFPMWLSLHKRRGHTKDVRYKTADAFFDKRFKITSATPDLCLPLILNATIRQRLVGVKARSVILHLTPNQLEYSQGSLFGGNFARPTDIIKALDLLCDIADLARTATLPPETTSSENVPQPGE